MTYLSRTTDAANHLQMTLAVVRHDGYFALLNGLDEHSTRMAQHYPPALSGVVGMVMQLFTGRNPDIDTLVHAGAIAFAVVLALTAYALTAWAAETLKGTGADTQAGLALLTVLSFGIIALGPVALLYSDAAYAQLLASLGVLLAVWSSSRANTAPLAALVVVSLGSVLALQAWYLVAPGLLLPWLRLLRGSMTRYALLAAVPTGLASAFPLLLGPGGNHVTTLGFIDIPDDRSNIALLVAGLVALAAIMALHPIRRAREPLLVTCVAMLITPIAIAFAQIALTGGISYYFFKTLLGAALFSTSAVVVAAVLSLRVARELRGPRQFVSLAVIAAMLSPVAAFAANPAMRVTLEGQQPSPVLPILHKGRTIMALSAQTRLLAAMLRDNPDGVDERHDVWVGGDCIGAQGYILAKWLYDLTLTWTPRRQEIIQAYRLPSKDLPAELSRRALEPEVERIDIYTSATCPMVEYVLNPKIHLHTVPAS
jgi:hypothetical protein